MARSRSRPNSSIAKPLSAGSTTRFRETNEYRAHREWLRYEGTGQRDLFRELRERFLRRHAAEKGWVLDLGSGPGRFLSSIGGPGVRRLALDVSREMLALVPATWLAVGGGAVVPDRVRGDAVRPPLVAGRWEEVVLLGNTLGFAGARADRLLAAAERLAAPGGTLVIEIAPAPGERSRYLARLPPSSVARLLRSPLRAVLNRLDREGFRGEPPRHATPRTFRRYSVADLVERLRPSDWELTETMSVAPALGPDGERIAAARADPKSWARLLELEEEIGRRPDRWKAAAAVLLSARRVSSMRMIK